MTLRISDFANVIKLGVQIYPRLMANMLAGELSHE